MKKILKILVCLLFALNLIGCANGKNNTSINNEWQRTALEIYSVEGDTNIGTMSSVNELENYFNILDEDEWQLLEKTPDSLKPLYYFNVYSEVVEPVFTKNNEPWVSAIRYILYESNEGYCISIWGSDLPVTYWMIDSSIAENIISFVQNDNVNNNKSIENIVKNWGISNFDKEKIFENYDSSGAGLTYADNNLGDILLDESAEVTYAGIATVSKHQKLEKISANDESSLFATEDLNEIVDFLNNEQTKKWKQLEEIPEDAEIKYIFIRSAAHKKTLDTTLYEMYRHILYVKEDKYYVTYMFPTGLVNETIMEEQNFYYSIPTEIGEYLCNYGVD